MNLGSVSIRLNPFKTPDSPLPILEGAGAVPWCKYGFMLKERPVFTLHPLFHAGCYYVQDSSAMYVGHVFRKMLSSFGKPGIRVLDLCAAPGGKTTDLAASLREAYGNDFLLVSNEVMKQRAGILDDNVAIWGDPNVVVTSVDPAVLGRMSGFFDIIVADVPCSGEGMFRKDPKAQEQWSTDVVSLCASRQKRIVADVWPSLRQGGILIYSTCTYEQAENDDNLEWAAAQLGGEIIEPGNEFASSGVALTAHGNILRVGEVPGEGQWVGALRKTALQPQGRSVRLEDLHPLRIGLRKGTMKGRDMVPDPDYALSIAFDGGGYPLFPVDKKTALHFLHRDSLVLEDAPRGYIVLTYRGIPLGFVKNIGSRCNNLHPQNRRILMDVE